LLIEQIPRLAAHHVLCTSLGRAQFAAEYARANPQAAVACHFLDLYLAQEAESVHADGPENLSILCASDFPDEEFDAVVLPLTRGGDAELARDQMQAAHEALRTGGRMFAAVDNPRDKWLHEELQKLFPKVTRQPAAHGVVYSAMKAQPLKKVKAFDAEFAFRDQGRLIKAFSRPGVFSHRHLDTGARAMLEAMEVREANRVLDLGCGSGVLSLAAALRAPGVRVHAVDSNARAIQCTLRGAELSGLSNITVQLDADARVEPVGSYDLVVANPPYYSHYRISEIFAQCAAETLRRGGVALFVTKNVDWYVKMLPNWFDEIAVREVRRFQIVSAVGRGPE
jgi:16S rRNA (guanine1207-N2)-methyltransferase